MTLGRTVVVPGMIAEYESFAGLVRRLSKEQWEEPSRCQGWSAADVAGHVVGQLTDVSTLRLDGLGTPEVTQRQVEERRGRGPDELADELDGATKAAGELAAAFDDQAWDAPGPPGTPGTLGQGLESLWFDTFLHADDIRDAIGEAPVVGEGVLPSVSHIAQTLTDQGWSPVTLRLDGMEEFLVSGGGRVVTGDPMTFILVSTGRADPGLMGFDDSVNIYR